MEVPQSDPALFQPHDSLGLPRLMLTVKHAPPLILIGAERRHFHFAKLQDGEDDTDRVVN